MKYCKEFWFMWIASKSIENKCKVYIVESKKVVKWLFATKKIINQEKLLKKRKLILPELEIGLTCNKSNVFKVES